MSDSAVRQNLTLRRGDDETRVFRFWRTRTVPIDLTGNTYTAMIRENPDDPTPAAQFVCTVGEDDQSTYVSCFLENCPLTPGIRYFWDLQETAAGTGYETTVVTGRVNVKADVSR